MPSWDHTFENWLWRDSPDGDSPDGDSPDGDPLELNQRAPVGEPISQRPTSTVVFDIDGVLSDAGSRQHFIEYPRRDWDAFFHACGDDPLIEEVARLLDVLDPRHRVVLLTGRPIRVQPQTLGWLQRYGLRWDLLIMRDFGDYSAARSFKQRTVRELRSRSFDLQLAFEDDPRNVDMFHAEAVPCVYIHSGYYDR